MARPLRKDASPSLFYLKGNLARAPVSGIQLRKMTIFKISKEKPVEKRIFKASSADVSKQKSRLDIFQSACNLKFDNFKRKSRENILLPYFSL